jgi:hypothetical protein
MKFDLTEDTFLLYAIKYYDNAGYKGIQEFYDDLKRIKYIKRLFSRYKSGGGLKERLILNHITVLYNLFGAEATAKMLFFKIDKACWSELKTFLLYLNLMPENVVLYKNIKDTDIPINLEIANTLREL